MRRPCRQACRFSALVSILAWTLVEIRLVCQLSILAYCQRRSGGKIGGLRHATETIVPMPATAAAQQICSAEHARQRDEDYSAVIALMEDRARLTRKPEEPFRHLPTTSTKAIHSNIALH